MKVAIIGAGAVGATAAQRIVESNIADVALVDIVPGKAQGLALDLSSAASIIGHTRSIIGTTDYKDIAGSNIVILAAGKARAPGQSRRDLLENNARVVRDIAKEITRYCVGAVAIVVTNPVDVMTYLVYKTTGFAANQIIGMSGVSDCARFNMLAAQELNISSPYIQSIIIGAHSDSMVILPRLSTALSIPLTELLPEDRIKSVVSRTRSFGTKIVELLGKGSAYYGPAAGVFLLVDSIINDRKNILCACAYLSGEYGCADLCIGVPVKIGRMGIEEIIEIKLSREEKEAFLNSVRQVKEANKKIGA